MCSYTFKSKTPQLISLSKDFHTYKKLNFSYENYIVAVSINIFEFFSLQLSFHKKLVN